MSVIERNEYGAIGVNKNVIEKMIIESLLSKREAVLLCNKKGKAIKDKPTPLIEPDYYDAIDYIDKRGNSKVSINVLVMKGVTISAISDELFEAVEDVFNLLRLDKPGTITIKVRGVISADTVVKRNIEVVRKNA